MENWIPFGEGEYVVDQALLVAEDNKAMAVDDVVVEIYADQRGQRFLKGRGRIRNILMIELHEDSDDLDLLLDFGDEFKYLLKEPVLQSGKVFAPDARSVLQFIPSAPWEQIPTETFADLIAGLNILSDSDIK
jgi:hypothetical protein